MSDSPYSEKMERKDSIRRFLRDQFRDDKKKEKKEMEKECKESKESKENKENIANANASSTASTSSGATATSSETAKANTETKSKSSAYRLFRTVSFDSFVAINTFSEYCVSSNLLMSKLGIGKFHSKWGVK